MKLFLTLMAGDTVVDAKPIFVSSSPDLINAVIGRLDLMVDDAERDARERFDGERIKGCEVVHASWNNYGCLELLIRLPQGPVGHEVKVADYTTLILHGSKGDD